MSIKLDWEVTDAPPSDEAPSSRPAPAAAAPARPQFTDQPISARPTGRSGLRWLAGLAIVAAAAAGGLWYYTRAGWQRVTDDVRAAVRYEDQQAAQGNAELLLAVQDRTNLDWLAVRHDEVAARQPAPQPLPRLSPGEAPATLTDLTVLDTDYVEASVARQFATVDGQTLTFTLPQFYRHGSGGDWLRSAPPGSFWGNWQDWQGANLDIRYSERDADFVAQVGRLLDDRLADACAAWAGGCPNAPPVRLYLSGFVGSLEYDPLANVEVLIQSPAPDSGTNSPAAPGYFLSVPSPQIAGVPADASARAYLADYLAVRLIAARARQLSTSPEGYLARTTQAILALGLTNVDPGYLASGQPQPDHSRVRANTLDQPEQLALGARLALPASAPGQPAQ